MALLGLSVEQCVQLEKKHHIYVVKSSRIAITGITQKNVKKLADGIKAVLTENN